MTPDWRGVNVICIVLSLNIIFDPFLKYWWECFLHELFADLGKLRVNLSTIILLDYELLTIHFFSKWIENEELMVTRFQKSSKNIVTVTCLFQICFFVGHTSRLIYICHRNYVVFVAFEMQQSIPALKLLESTQFFDSLIILSSDKIVN